jgi:hypothetical protein
MNNANYFTRLLWLICICAVCTTCAVAQTQNDTPINKDAIQNAAEQQRLAQKKAVAAKLAQAGCVPRKAKLKQTKFNMESLTTSNSGILASSTTNTVFHSFGAFWAIGGGYSTTVVVKNKDAENKATGTLTVFASDGTVKSSKQIEVPANSVIRMSLADIIGKQGAMQSGGLSMEYHQLPTTIGEVIVENDAKGLIFDLPIQGGYRYDTQSTLFAPWWLPDGLSDGKVSLFNGSTERVLVSPTFLINGKSFTEPSIELQAHQARQLSIRDLLLRNSVNASSGIISLRYTGSPHALFPALLLANSATGFSLVPDFNAKHDRPEGAVAAQTSWQFPDVLLTSDATLGFNPKEHLTAYALLSNGLSSQISPQLTAHITQQNGKVSGIPLNILPLGIGETRLIDLSEILPKNVSHAALTVSHSGNPGDLALTIFSVGASKDFVFRAEGTMHPSKTVESSYWDVSGDFGAVLTVQNTSDVDVSAKATLHIPSAGTVKPYVISPIVVPAHGSQLINLKKIILSGKPDQNGNVIPVNATFGTLTLNVPDSASKGFIFGESVTFDRIKGGYGEFGEDPCDFCDDCEDCIDDGDGGDCVPSCDTEECCPPPPDPVPSQLMVLTDSAETQNCGAGLSTVLRQITYQIQDQFGSQLTSAISMKENVPATTSSCNGGAVTTGSSCIVNTSLFPGLLAEFTDFLRPGCPTSSTVTPCGFTFSNQQWQWCPSGSAPQSMGTIGPVNAENIFISVDGNITGFTLGTIFPQ